MIFKLLLALSTSTVLLTGCGSNGMSDEQFEKLIYEQKLLAYKQCLVEHNGYSDSCRALEP
jgi:hypothetical protein